MRQFADPLSTSISKGDIEQVRRLLAAGRDPNQVAEQDEVPPLLLAAINDQADIMRVLIAGGADLYVIHHHLGSVLAIVAQFASVQALQVLIECGLPIDLDLGGGRTALMEAARENSPASQSRPFAALARALVGAGANINAQDHEGITPLMWSCRTTTKRVEVLKILLQAGADLELRDKKENTAIIHAAGSRNAEAIRLLMAAGCNIDARNAVGRRAVDVIQTRSPACLRARELLERRIGAERTQERTEGIKIGQVESVGVTVFRHKTELERYLSSYGLELWTLFERAEAFYLTSPARILVAQDHWQPRIGLRATMVAHLLSGQSCPWGWLKHGLSLSLAHDDAADLARINRRMLAGLQNRQALAASKFFRHRMKAFTPIRSLGSKVILIRRKAANFALQRQFVGQMWSVVEFLCGSGATEERAVAFRAFFQDAERDRDPEGAIERHFGLTGDELLSQWRSWVVAQGIGVHGAPQPELAAAIMGGPAAAARSSEAPLFDRIVAIRGLGMLGFAAFADVLIDIARHNNGELRLEACIALEMISGQTLAAARAERLAAHAPALDPIEYWESWWASLPESAKRTT